MIQLSTTSAMRWARPVAAALALTLVGCAGPAATNGPASPGPRTVQAGAPGTDSRILSPSDLASVDAPLHTEADVRFMQGMIPHHLQALDMTALVPDRSADRGFRQLALRMEISQKDEIQLMERWLSARGEATRGGVHGLMPGMLTPDQMEELRVAEGVRFERLFLEYMIQHHEGALTMVATLFATPGGGQESEAFQFANDVDVDQRMEIARMRQMLEQR